MNAILYFIKGLSSPEKGALAEAGLSAVLGKGFTSAGGTFRDESGLVVGHTTGALVIDEAVQDWRYRGNGVWMGWAKGVTPGPADLARKTLIDGHLVTLGDGRGWLIPCARVFPVGTRLPQTLVMEKGVLQGKSVKEFAEFSKMGGELWDGLFMPSEEDPEQAKGIPFSRAWEIAAAALGVNYRVGHEEINDLELIRTDNIREILGAIIDEPAMVALAKKKEGDAAEAVVSDVLADGGGGEDLRVTSDE